MPELPEVETVVRGLRPALTGRRIVRAVAHRPDLRWPLPVDLGQRMTGATVLSVTRRAKYGLIATDRGDSLIFHLGMSGRMRIDPADASPHDHVEFVTDEGRRIVLTDPRRFGMMDLVETAHEQAHPLLAGLGPEPLTRTFSAAGFVACVRGRIAPVKALLLDQRVVAGIGNIYACEALHAARIHPTRAGGSIGQAEAARLVKAVKAVLEAAIAAGGSSLRDHVQPNGVLGYFQHSWRVYGRAGEPCGVCGTEVERIVMSARSTFFCAVCQQAD